MSILTRGSVFNTALRRRGLLMFMRPIHETCHARMCHVAHEEGTAYTQMSRVIHRWITAHIAQERGSLIE